MIQLNEKYTCYDCKKKFEPEKLVLLDGLVFCLYCAWFKENDITDGYEPMWAEDWEKIGQ